MLVDDGSEAKYQPLFQELGEMCIVLHHPRNLGKGAAIKTALRYVKEELWEYDVIGTMDADGQHMTEDMERVLEQAALHPEALVLGCRTVDGKMPWKSRMGNRITRAVFRRATGAWISDTQTGLRAFFAKLLEQMLAVPGERYEYEMNVLMDCVRQKIPLIEVPVQTIYQDRKNSSSHFRRVRDSFRIYRKLLRFSAVSLSSFVLDYGLFALFTLLFSGISWGIGASNILARFLSATWNYLGNCRLVFAEKPTWRTAATPAGRSLRWCCWILISPTCPRWSWKAGG